MIVYSIHVFVRKAGSLFIKIGNQIIKFSNKIYQPQQSLFEKNKKEWYRIKGDENLRVNYNLTEDSIVFDIGGFKGDWCAEVAVRYSPTIFVFEPVKEFYNSLINRFNKNKKIKILEYGLASNNSKIEIAVMSEASSVFRNNNSAHYVSCKEYVDFKDINEFIFENNIAHIDLMKINIEGGEYDLLESLISSGGIKKIDNVQVQFHDFVENAESRMKEIKKKLNETHELTYEYIFVWENWKLKTAPFKSARE